MKKILLPTIVVFIAWMILDFIIHNVILASAYADTAGLWRPEGEMKMGLMYVVTLIYAFSFVGVYSWFVGDKGIDTGLKYGLLLGLGVGVGMGYGSYAVMPIPYKMAITWFLGTLVEFGVGGIIAGALSKGTES